MKDKVKMWFAWHMPKWLAYWCTVRLGVHATTGRFSDQVVPDLTYMDALKRWDGDSKADPR